ncbi:MAG: RES domain-containing protein [Verrucomicrobia bacterium]|nr:MAG: RES domain-containing protein [Verrucomicrobiota bacterium]
MPLAWRLVREQFAGTAFSGDGAARYGGRWNSRGLRVVYASESRALAALETLVHLNPPLPFRYKFIPVRFDAAWVETLTAAALPADWRQEPPPPSTRALGDRWIREGRSPVLAVPSIIIPQETNYLLNPAHPDFAAIERGPAEDFDFDPRLLR